MKMHFLSYLSYYVIYEIDLNIVLFILVSIALFQAKILCSSLCKCSGCKNFEESADRKTLMHLADAAGEFFS